MALVETYRGVVFPWLADQMRHLTTSRYLEMFAVASYHFAHRLGLAYDASTNMGLADVRHEIDYKAEAPVGGLVLIRSGVISVGRTSFRARHVMTDADVKRVHCGVGGGECPIRPRVPQGDRAVGRRQGAGGVGHGRRGDLMAAPPWCGVGRYAADVRPTGDAMLRADVDRARGDRVDRARMGKQAETRNRIGSYVAGVPVGILCLDTRHKLFPGNVQHAESFTFPVLYEPVKVEDPWCLLRGDPALTPAIVSAARKLHAAGVRAIAGACGSFAYYQMDVAREIDLPIFLSPMLLVPLLQRGLGARKLGVICAAKSSLNDRVWGACGIENADNLVIAEMVGFAPFEKMMRAEAFEYAELQTDVVAAAELQRQSASLGAILLQCSYLPPFARAIQQATGLPVFDMTQVIRWLAFAVGYPKYPSDAVGGRAP